MAPRRRLILVSLLVLAAFAKVVDTHPRFFGWPGAYILSAWTPWPIRLWALDTLGEMVAQAEQPPDALPLVKQLLRSDDPRIRRRGILFYDRIRSMDEFFDMERLTRDPDAEVRASAYQHLPLPSDRALATGVLMTGLRDDSDKVVMVSAAYLRLLRAKEALPELIAHLEAKRRTGTFNEADVVVGNVASELAGQKLHFRSSERMICGTAAMWAAEEWDYRLHLRAIRAIRSFWRSCRNWDKDRGVAPNALDPVDGSALADNFAERDELLDWWNKKKHPGQPSLRMARPAYR